MTAGAKPARRSQAARRTATREALLEAAVDCICDLGYAGATGAEIAARAALTRGAVQHHFETRDDLILAVIERVAALNVDVDTDALRALPPARRIDALIDNYHAVYTSRAFRAALHIWLGASGDPVLFGRLQDRIATAERLLAEIWDAVFADTRVPATELQAIRHLVLGAVRGHAIEDLFRLPHDWDAYAALLRDTTLARLTG